MRTRLAALLACLLATSGLTAGLIAGVPSAQAATSSKNLTITNTGVKGQSGDETNGHCW